MDANSEGQGRSDSSSAGQASGRLDTLIGFLVVVVGGGGLLAFLAWIFICVLPAATAATLFIGCLTVGGSVGVTLWTTHRRRMAEIELSHHAKRAEVYEDMIDFMFRYFFAAKFGEDQPSEEESTRAFADFTQNIILWGSPALLRSWIEFRQQGLDVESGKSSGGLETLIMLENFLLKIREDVGQHDEALQTGDILRTFVNDFGQQQTEA